MKFRFSRWRNARMFWIVGRTFDAVIPRIVVVGAVLVVFAVRLVVLFVVADNIVQREAVMGRDEIDAG